MRLSTQHKIIIGLGSVPIVLACIVMLSYQTTMNLLEANHRVVHTHEVISQIEQIQITLTDAETGQRGYIITGDESYLASYRADTARIDSNLNTLRQLSADSPDQQPRLLLLAAQVHERLRLLEVTTALRRANGFPAAQRLIQTDQEREAMDAIRTTLGELADAEQQLLQSRTDVVQAQSQQAIALFFAFGLLDLLMVVVACYFIRRDMVPRAQAAALLQQAHAALEMRVEARTAELAASNQRLSHELAERQRVEDALLVSEDRYRRLVETSPDGITLTDLSGTVLLANQQAALLHGFASSEELVHKNTLAFVAYPDRRQALVNTERIIKTGIIRNTEYTLLKADGSQFPVETSMSLIRDNAGQPTALISVMRDVTGRKQTQDHMHLQLRRLTALRNIDLAITGSLDLRLVLNVLLDEVISQLDVDAVDLLLLNPHTQSLDCIAARGFYTNVVGPGQSRLEQDYVRRVVLDQESLHIGDLADVPDFVRATPLAEEGFVAYYAVPLIAKGRVSGVLEIFHRNALAPNAAWVDFLHALAGQAAIAVDNASLFRDLQRSNLELSLAYETTLEGWSRALELRDKETEGHTQRVAELTVRLARMMGISEADLVHVRRGALLHDIGKMGIPDAILLKPGPLTDEEWAIMRRHPSYAFELLAPISFLRPALDIPHYHHECWDGTGYPYGLKGEQIPLAARLFSIVDVWDALSSDRPYRPHWPQDRIQAHIQALSGTHFDPRVVEAFQVLQPSAACPIFDNSDLHMIH